MPYFNNNDINLLFIHIPKTGGTSLEYYFSSKFKIPLNNNSLYGYINYKSLSDANMEIKSSLQHITHNQITRYSNIFQIHFDNIKIITIVRNPYHRIISDLFFYHLINTNTSKQEVFDIIIKYLRADPTTYDNHNIPQYKFITNNKGELIPNIHILRTESLTDDMKKIGYDDFDVRAQVNPSSAARNNYNNYLNNEIIEIINEFYHLDFLLFDYDKIKSAV